MDGLFSLPGGSGGAVFAGLNVNGVIYATSATAVASTAVGTATHVLTSNGAGVAPTFQAPAAGISVPGSTTVNNFVLWNSTTGAAIKDATVMLIAAANRGFGIGNIGTTPASASITIGGDAYNAAADSVAVGQESHVGLEGVSYGYRAGYGSYASTGNAYFGGYAGYNTLGAYNVAIGHYCGANSANAVGRIDIGGRTTTYSMGTESIAIGYDSRLDGGVAAANEMSIGSLTNPWMFGTANALAFQRGIALGYTLGDHPTAAVGSIVVKTGTDLTLNADNVVLTNPKIKRTAGIQVMGTNTNDAAPATYYGERITQSRVASAAAAVTTATALNLTASVISLTAGDWDVSGTIVFLAAATTSVTQLQAAISKTSATLPAADTVGVPTAGEYINLLDMPATIPTGAMTLVIPPTQVSIAATTSIYLVGKATFTVSTLTAYGSIVARRVR